MIVGIEVGGTFTDLIAVLSDGRAVIHKTPSTPDDPSRAAIAGLTALLERIGASGSDVAELLHGSTIAANALIQRRGGRVALVTTEGFRDVLYIQRQDKSVVYEMFYQKPVPLLTRDRVFEVPERIAADGSQITPLDEAAAGQLIDGLVLEDDVDSIAVCLLHAYAKPDNEQALGRLIRERHPHVYVSLSSEIAPEHREYERTSTTVISAFVRPIVDRYLSRFETAARDVGVTQPPLIMLSNGGVAPVEAARRLAANMFLSGPAAAVTGAANIAHAIDTPNIISIDVGGTSSDVCLITGGAPETTMKGTSEFSVDGLPLNIVMTDIVSIGAGGGSIAWIDDGGMLQVGPQSAGAMPGPACYGHGGEAFCLTDAMLLLGLLHPRVELPGGIVLDPALSRAASKPLQRALDLSATELAERVFRIATANMAQALRRVSVKRGHDPRDYALFACGGAGALIATALADEVGIHDVIVPPNPGVFSAVGLSVSDVRMDYVLAEGAQSTADLSKSSLMAKVEILRDRAREAFRDLGYALDTLKFEIAIDCRYRGQGYELRVSVDADKLQQDGPAYLAERFHEEHARQYGHSFRERDVEVISFRLSSIRPRGSTIAPVDTESAAIPTGERTVLLAGEERTYPVLARSELTSDFASEGPTIIVEESTSTIVPPGWRVKADITGVLRLTQQ